MADKPATPAAPTFDAVPVADLGPAQRESSPETIALGAAILAVIGDGSNAARDPGTFTDKAAANKRAAVLKRAVRATGNVPDGKTVGARIITADDGKTFRVAVYLATPKPRKPKAS